MADRSFVILLHRLRQRIDPAGGRKLLAPVLLFTALAAGPGLLAPAAETPAPAVPADQFARLHALIKPQPGESKWAAIPWLTDLPEARRRAVAEDRPLFIWRAGGGEVLGRA
jgi:hypothetical protein